MLDLSLSSRFRRALEAVALLIGLGLAGCSSGGGGSGGRLDASPEAGQCKADAGGTKMNGDSCACASDCQSGFCVDGVCCNTACTETCRACNTQGSPGVCAFVPAGGDPREATDCKASDVSTCGLDGTCDGSGACRMHVQGAICKPGACEDAAVVDVNVCDGRGHCKSGPATICAPFNCDPTTRACVVTCKVDTDCVSGVSCVNGSCGPKPRGAVCGKDSDCASGFCTDGVCCNIGCHGACATCNQTGRLGTCWPIDAGNDDPRRICHDQGPGTCGQTGACDGVGGCALYVAETICVAPSCSGDRLNTAGTCDGLSRCRPPGVRACAPYRCSDGACIAHCASDADCIGGQICDNGSCGPKPNGQPCANGGECVSAFCVDGVCCDEACGGSCRSCALPSSMGKCTPAPDGAVDPRGVCVDKGAANCGTDGTCDGASGCRKYDAGTICAAETCSNGVYTPPGACSAAGACVAPDATACAPFACNGARCFVACTADDNCAAGKVCENNSCGLKLEGAFCADKRECASGNCAQGVCCATPCASACKSCALPASMGLCTNVPDGQSDPTGTCLDAGAASCGTNGRCQAGACQTYAQGTSCNQATCPAGTTTFTPAGSCDGAGTCVTPTATSCFPFRCGAAICKSSCTADADCAPPGVCSSDGSCGLKPDGAICAYGTECKSTFCEQGTCCHTACAGTCMSCAISGSAGTCAPVATGWADPAGQCRDQGAASCGTDGVCDGAGGCELYGPGIDCAPPSCPLGGTTATLARLCDGNGTCRPAATQSCLPYNCNGTSCRAACSSDADCGAGNFCNGGSCGLKRLGQICTAGTDCASGNCVDGVCCSAASCGTCTACNVTGGAGTCQPVPPGAMEPHGGCLPAPPCGFNGTCDGAGACLPMAAGTSCGTVSCSGSTLTPVGSCDGAGACTQTPASCAPYVCGTSACNTTCVTNLDCASGFMCLGGSCTNLAANGTACTSSTQCISGHCVQGFCCGSAACSSCNSCAIPGKEGTCSPIADGTVCGTANCDMAGRLHPAATCAAGVCKQGALIDCTPYACDSTGYVCKTSCLGNADCAKQNKCTLAADAGAGVCN